MILTHVGRAIAFRREKLVTPWRVYTSSIQSATFYNLAV